MTEPHQIAATELRDFADFIDLGPDVPLRPSIYSALARERADDLDPDNRAPTAGDARG